MVVIPKPLRAVILSRTSGEESSFETFRGVYPEQSRRAQGDMTDRFRDRF